MPLDPSRLTALLAARDAARATWNAAEDALDVANPPGDTFRMEHMPLADAAMIAGGDLGRADDALADYLVNHAETIAGLAGQRAAALRIGRRAVRLWQDAKARADAAEARATDLATLLAEARGDLSHPQVCAISDAPPSACDCLLARIDAALKPTGGV